MPTAQKTTDLVSIFQLPGASYFGDMHYVTARRLRGDPGDDRYDAGGVAIVTVHLPYGFSSIKLQSVTAAGAHFGQPGYETDLLYLVG